MPLDISVSHLSKKTSVKAKGCQCHPMFPKFLPIPAESVSHWDPASSPLGRQPLLSPTGFHPFTFSWLFLITNQISSSLSYLNKNQPNPPAFLGAISPTRGYTVSFSPSQLNFVQELCLSLACTLEPCTSSDCTPTASLRAVADGTQHPQC